MLNGEAGEAVIEESPDQKIYDEFFRIRDLGRKMSLSKKQQSATFHSARLPCNMSKNRYHDVLAVEFTRVRLTPIPKEKGSDYINANFIHDGDYGLPTVYIACQAPLPSTVNDFWRMVWEQDVPVILMLTKTIENEVPKAHEYWPQTKKIRKFGDLGVSLEESTETDSITTRRFKLWKKDESGRVLDKEVVQLHYCDWPDFGVPETTEGILKLVSLSRFYQSRGRLIGSRPIVCHCSAGIGRTGVFVAVDITIRKLQRQVALHGSPYPLPSVMQTVLWMRQQRRGMVQTPEQYKFIYDCVRDFVSQERAKGSDLGSLSIPADLLNQDPNLIDCHTDVDFITNKSLCGTTSAVETNSSSSSSESTSSERTKSSNNNNSNSNNNSDPHTKEGSSTLLPVCSTSSEPLLESCPTSRASIIYC